MSEIYVGEMQDEDGNTVYPHTEADVVFCTDGKNVQEKINNELLPNTKILRTMEEIEANTNPENIAGAIPVKELNNKLAHGRVELVVQSDGTLGYRLDGADAVIPFSNGRYRVTVNGSVGYFISGYGYLRSTPISSYVDIEIKGNKISVGALSQSTFTTTNIQPNDVVVKYGGNASTTAKATISSVAIDKR